MDRSDLQECDELPVPQCMILFISKCAYSFTVCLLFYQGHSISGVYFVYSVDPCVFSTRGFCPEANYAICTI